MIFGDRSDAGKQLAQKLLQYKNQNAVVVALPRGGVPVGYEIAKALHARFAVFPVRKIGAPFNPEFAIGAIAPDDVVFVDEEIVAKYEIPQLRIESVIQNEQKELQRRRQLYGVYEQFEDSIVILCDDGLATGMTAKAAITSIKRKHPKKIILAVPCSPTETVDALEKLADACVCLQKKEDFSAVGAFYRYFPQVEDDEVLEFLNKAKIFKNNL